MWVLLLLSVVLVPAMGWQLNHTFTGSIEGITCDSTGQYLTVAQIFGDSTIYFSADSGATWTAADVPTTGYATIASNPVETQYVAAVDVSGNTVVSSDYGQSWSQVPSTVPLVDTYEIDAVAVANGNSTLIVMSESSTANGQCLYVSTNTGASWSSARGPNLANVTCKTVAANGDATQIVLSVLATNGNPNGLYLSTDLGVSWTLVHPIAAGVTVVKSIVYNAHLSIFYATIFGQTTNPVIRSNTAATSWTEIVGTWPTVSAFLSANIAVSYDGQYIVVNNDGQIEFSTDGGASYIEYRSSSLGSYVCVATGNTTTPALFMYQSFQSVYMTNTVPNPSPTKAPSFYQPLCDAYLCPTSCPYGYSKKYVNAYTGCTVYCMSEPVDGQCVFGGSSCTSSCRTAGELAGIIIGSVFGFFILVAIVYFVVVRYSPQPPAKHQQGSEERANEMQTVKNPISTAQSAV
jgi:hypothetical protein